MWALRADANKKQINETIPKTTEQFVIALSWTANLPLIRHSGIDLESGRF